MMLVGFAAYAVLGLAGHALTPRDYAAVASLYLLTVIVGPGIFIAVEQETSREVSSRLAAGLGTQPVVRSASLLSTLLAVLLMLMLLALSPVLVTRVFDGAWSLLAAALVAVAGSASVSVLRGMFAGQRRYGWYAGALAAEGLGRLVPTAIVLAVGASVGGFGFAFALGTVLATVAIVGGTRRGTAGPTVSLPKMGGSITLLACASGLTLLVANLAPVVLTSRLIDDPRTAASFVSLFVLARLPLFFFGPIQAFLLPSVTDTLARGEITLIRTRIRNVIISVVAIGLLGAAFIALLGPWAAQVFFAAPMSLSTLVAGLLGTSTVMMMLAQVLQPTLVALGNHRMTTAAWIAGALAFLVLLFSPQDPLVAAVTAQFVGPVIVVTIMALALRSAYRQQSLRIAASANPSGSGPQYGELAPPKW
ncbi:MAG: hypothetical protein GEU83_08890 [Pseudonocardiaceae bacterium]|nr:hypothetical protein [Pseudonocardiaceae bacterium]